MEATERDQLRAMVQAFAQQLAKAFPKADAEFKRIAAKMLQRELPPHRGRPKARHLDQAEQLRAGGLTYRQACFRINAAFRNMRPDEQRAYIEAIKNALKMRRARKPTSVICTP